MIVRGIDPGSHELSWCDLDAREGGPATFVALGSVGADRALSLVADLDPTRYAVAIERAYGLRISPAAGIAQAKATTAELLATNWLACQIVEECRRRDVRVFEVDEDPARRGVGVQYHKAGNGDGCMKADKQIGVIVRELIRGFPQKRHESNKHTRDAAVYALHGAHLLSVEYAARIDAMVVSPIGVHDPTECGPDSFGGSDY